MTYAEDDSGLLFHDAFRLFGILIGMGQFEYKGIPLGRIEVVIEII